MTTQYVNEVLIPVRNVELSGDLIIPKDAGALVVFSHGSGSSRKSARNRMVAEKLQQHQIGTLLFDLLTEEEDENYNNRFNIDLLTQRLIAVTEWLGTKPETVDLKLGYFGASTGAASALKAAAVLPQVKAVVSRGGRPDMAMEALPKVHAPVLLIVGSLDKQVIQLNKQAYAQLTCVKELKIIEGATHLFEEPGTLQKVSAEAIVWFGKYLIGHEY